MRRTEDEFRRQRWVDIFFLTCFIFLGAILLGLAIKGQ